MSERIVAIFTLAITSILLLTISCNSPEPVEKENRMVSIGEKPLLDTSTPTIIETATFALG